MMADLQFPDPLQGGAGPSMELPLPDGQVVSMPSVEDSGERHQLVVDADPDDNLVRYTSTASPRTVARWGRSANGRGSRIFMDRGEILRSGRRRPEKSAHRKNSISFAGETWTRFETKSVNHETHEMTRKRDDGREATNDQRSKGGRQ
jgi:hypothetical protein